MDMVVIFLGFAKLRLCYKIMTRRLHVCQVIVKYVQGVENKGEFCQVECCDRCILRTQIMMILPEQVDNFGEK